MSDVALGLYKYVDGVNDTPFPSSASQAVLTGWQYNAKRMGGTPSITGGTIIHEDCLDDEWSEDVYVEYKGEKFFAPHKPTSSYSSQSVMYDHKVDFFSERAVLDNVYFYDVVSEQDSGGKPISNNTKFTFFGTISEFIIRLNASMARSNTGYSVVLDDGQENSDLEKQIKFSEKYISEALQEGFKAYGIPYYFVGKVCHYGVGQSSILDNMVFEYGRNKSLIAMTKTNANTKIVNRITGVGSQDNIPYFYPNSSEEGMADVSELSSSTITQLNVVDDVLLAKKVARNDVLEYGAWEDTTLDIDMFYGDGEAYSWEVPATGADFGGKTVHIVIPLHITFNCSSLVLRLTPWPILRPRHSTVTYANFVLTPDITGKTITPSGIDNYIFLVATGNIIKGTYNLEFDATFPNLGSEQLIDFSGKDKIEITAIAWQDQQTLALFQDDLSDVGLSIVGTPSSGDTFKRVVSRQVVPQPNLMPSIYRSSNGNERFYNATNNTYINPDTGEYYVFPKPYRSGKPKEYLHDEKDIKPTIVGIVNANNEPIDQVIKFAFDENDGDELDENGNYVHPYFFALLHKTDGEYGFNLFDQAIDEEEMTLAMTSGSLGGCEFIIGVGEENQKNTVQIELDANLQPVLDEDGYPVLKRDDNGDVLYGLSGRQAKQVPQDWQNDTRNNEVWVALKKDTTTYNVVMPNATYNYKPQETDTDNFVLLHIDLPKAYILAAEKALEDALIAYMYEANFEHWNFSIDFSRIYFKENTSVANALDENKRIKIKYNGVTYERYISSYSYKTSPSERLPNISVELAEELQSSSNPIDSAISEVTNLVEIQANAMIGYQQVARLARAALPSQQVLNAGNKTLPIYFDGTQAKTIEGLDVPENIHSEKNIEADGGVSAQGIVDMTLEEGSGGSGGGTVKGVKIGNGEPIGPDDVGIVPLPAYPSSLSELSGDSAHRTVSDEEKIQWSGKYSKPGTGIPKTDLASGVQTSLGKADSSIQGVKLNGVEITPDGNSKVNIDDIPKGALDSSVQTSLDKADSAYQKPQAGIPSTDMSSGVQSSLNKADSAYQKPQGGIPKTDLDSGVKTSLGKADTAVQPNDLTPIADDITQLETDVDNLEGRMDSAEETLSGLSTVATTGDYDDLTDKPQVVTFANLDPTEAENQKKLTTAKAVAILKDRIGVEDFDEYNPNKTDGYRVGDCVKVTTNGIATAYRFKLATPKGTAMVGHVEKITFKTLANPLNIVGIENILI